MKKLTEKQLLAALKKLERAWPDGYSVFSHGGSLILAVRREPIDNEKFVPEYGGVEIGCFNIPSDGGDPFIP